MRMHRHMRRTGRKYRIEFVADPIAWTEVPSTTQVLGRQRRRWHRGLWEVLWTYRGMLGNPRYGRIGMVVVPWFWAFELLTPLLDLLGLVIIGVGWAIGVVDLKLTLLYLLVAMGYALLVALATLAIEEFSFHKYPRWRDLGVALLASVAESFGYRQLNAWWRLQGLWDGIRGTERVWGVMTRSGFTADDRVAQVIEDQAAAVARAEATATRAEASATRAEASIASAPTAATVDVEAPVGVSDHEAGRIT